MTAHVLGRLSAYIDGELPEAERQELAAHLRECPECEALRQELLLADLAAKEAELAPAGYFDSLPGRIRERVAGASGGVGRLADGRPRAAAASASGAPSRAHARAPRPRVPVWGWAVAAGLLVALATPLLLRDRPSPAPAEATAPLPTSKKAAPAVGPAAPTAPGEAQEALATPRQAGEMPPATADPTTALTPQQAAELSRSQLADATARSEARGGAPASRPPAAAPALVASAPATARVAPTPPAADELAGREAASNEAERAKRLAAQAVASPPPAPARAFEEQSLRKSEGDAEKAFAAPPPAAPVAAAAEEPVASKVGRAASAPLGATAAGLPGAPPARQAAEAKDQDQAGAGEYERMLARTAATAEQARALRAEWRGLAPRLRGAQADEARVRAIEAGALAYRVGRDARDAQTARADATAYLARPDAAQAARVRAVLATLDR